ncbi:flavin reductase family protein [Henriciella aquimarina]|uniref:flavin reductase family protein n=1 Tax=Henriciella aquimarina TaxID=545261 RepID=UPI0009FBAD89|nr:flavin reductase family protein [Henriciella aquimarina]
MTDSLQFKAAMARLGSAVCIIATDGPCGRYGITVSAVTSVSDDPPSLIVCVNRNSGANAAIKENGALSVNVLSSDQEEVSGVFATSKVDPRERFNTGDWVVSERGNLILNDSAALFECEVDKAVEYGTHTVFFCKVTDSHVGASENGLIYHGRAYHHIRPFE